MVKITNKLLIALRTTPRIDEHRDETLEEDLNGIHPYDSSKKRYDTGKPRLTMPDLSGLGPANVPESQGDRDVHTNLSSGYNKGSDAEGPARDDTGPGYTQEPTDPYYGTWAFNDESDRTMDYMFEHTNYDSKEPRYKRLNRLYGQSPVMWTRRYPVN